jgi:putative transposase
MALSQHDLLRLLESLRSADGLELVRSGAEQMLQELIDVEDRRGVERAHRDTHRAAQRAPRQDADYAGR